VHTRSQAKSGSRDGCPSRPPHHLAEVSQRLKKFRLIGQSDESLRDLVAIGVRVFRDSAAWRRAEAL